MNIKTELEKVISELELKSFDEGEVNDFDYAAAHLKSCEILNELIEVQIAVEQRDNEKIKAFIDA